MRDRPQHGDEDSASAARKPAAASAGSVLVLTTASLPRTLATISRLRAEAPARRLVVAAPRVEAWRYRDAGVETWITGELWLRLDQGPDAGDLAEHGIRELVLPVGVPRQSLFFLARWLRGLGPLPVRLGSSARRHAAASRTLFVILALSSLLVWGPTSITLRAAGVLDAVLLLMSQLAARLAGWLPRSNHRSHSGPVCHVIQSLGTGGAQRQLVEYLCRRHEHPVPAQLLVILDREITLREQLEAHHIPVHVICREARLGSVGRAALRALPSTTALVLLRRRLRQLEPRAAMGWFFQANLISAPAARLAGVPWVVSSIRNLSAWKTWPGSRTWWYWLADRLSAPVNDLVVANAAAVAADYSERSGLGQDRFEVVANGVDVDRAAAAQSAHIRTRLGVADDRPLLVTMGRFAPEKNQTMLLHCCAQLVARGHDIVLVIIGHGDLHAQLVELGRTLGIGDRVHFLGRVEDPLPVLRAADLFVLPSRIEGMPNAVMEAQACGTAVVATDCGGTAEVVEHGRSGLIVAVDDEAAMTEAIASMLHDPALRNEMGRRGQERMRDHFSLERMAAGIDRVTRRDR